MTSGGSQSTSRDLSDQTQRLLESAYQRGYFRVPRETTLVDLAADHGISDREASKRLRRGLDTVLDDALEE